MSDGGRLRTQASSDVARFLARAGRERRSDLERVRGVIRAHLPAGYEEAVSRNALVYQVPLAVYPDTYNKQPLWYVGLTSNTSSLSLHLMSVYGSAALRSRLEAGFEAAGKPLKLGKACLNFSRADDLALDVVGDIIAAIPMEKWVAIAKAARTRSRR